jgi:hypothetical protein
MPKAYMLLNFIAIYILQAGLGGAREALSSGDD